MAILFALAGKYLIYADPHEKSDVIAVLAGNDNSRIFEAASLYHQGIASNIILTKTSQTFGEFELPYTMLQEEMLLEMDIPDGAIYIAEITAKNTGQEARCPAIDRLDQDNVVARPAEIQDRIRDGSHAAPEGNRPCAPLQGGNAAFQNVIRRILESGIALSFLGELEYIDTVVNVFQGITGALVDWNCL